CILFGVKAAPGPHTVAVENKKRIPESDDVLHRPVTRRRVKDAYLLKAAGLIALAVLQGRSIVGVTSRKDSVTVGVTDEEAAPTDGSQIANDRFLGLLPILGRFRFVVRNVLYRFPIPHSVARSVHKVQLILKEEISDPW